MEEYAVTGWTHWENESYKEIADVIDFDNDRERFDKVFLDVYNAVIDFCVENKVYVSDNEHQGGDYGVPIVNNLYKLEFSLRTWAGLMAEVWSKINNKDYDYLDFYCDRYGYSQVDDIDGTIFNTIEGVMETKQWK